MRLAAYAGTSAALAVAALVKAFSQRPNFYSATVYLSQSNACLLILANLALVCAVSSVYGLQRLFYGHLRPIEIEQLTEKAWYAVLDTLLAMPSLRDDVGGWLVAIFFLLLAGKIWGWIGEGRVDVLEQQSPQGNKLLHIRLAASLAISLVFDILMCRYCFRTVVDNPRPGMMVMFTFEFAILAINSNFTVCRYALALLEAREVARQTKSRIRERVAEMREERLEAIRNSGAPENSLIEPTEDDVDDNEIDVPGWEEKRRYLFGLELITDFVKIVIYTVFFTISMTFIGLPMHVMRDVYLTVASFTKRIQDFSNYRRATQDMNTRYPDASEQELSSDNTCIVCRETMVSWSVPQDARPGSRRPLNEGQRAKKLPCGHILHLRCLKAWLERQQVCPTCRRPVIAPGATQQRNAQGLFRPGAAGPGAPRLGGAGGQPGPAQQDGGNGQNGRPPRRNNMRWWNIGPVRLGYYNGAPGQLPPELRGELPEGTTLTGELSRPRRQRTPLSTQQHLRAAELRLLRDAHNLQVERAQLANVQALESELVRLRGLRVGSSSESTSTYPTTTDAYRGLAVPTGLPPLPDPSQVPVMFQRFQAPPETQAPQQLPEGFTLPEGWTMVPLQRYTPPPIAQQQPLPQFVPPTNLPHFFRQPPLAGNNGAPVPPPVQMQEQPRPVPTPVSRPPVDTDNATALESATREALEAAVPQQGRAAPAPIPGGGFEPSMVAQTPTAVPSYTLAPPSAVAAQVHPRAAEAANGSVPPGWGFADVDGLPPPNGNASQTEDGSSPAEEEDDAGEGSEGKGEGKGKGKARAAQVEDAADEEP